MKKCVFVLGMALSAMVLVGCGDMKKSNSDITEGDVKQAVESLSDFQEGKYNVAVEVGYYELNDENQRLNLRKLASNGVLTYNAEQINEYDDNNNFIAAHVFVNVDVTAEGQKYVLAKSYIDSLNCDVDTLNRFASETYPMDEVSKKEIVPVRNPLVVIQNDSEEMPETQPESLSDLAQKTPTLYEAAKAKETKREVSFLSMKKSIYKIKDVVCDDLMKKQGNAQADVIVEQSEVTPFGRILDGYTKGEKKTLHVTLKYYIERGWGVESQAPVQNN